MIPFTLISILIFDIIPSFPPSHMFCSFVSSFVNEGAWKKRNKKATTTTITKQMSSQSSSPAKHGMYNYMQYFIQKNIINIFENKCEHS